MNAAPLARRPLACLKAGLRQTRQHRLFARQLATEATTTPTETTEAAATTPRAPLQHDFFKLNDRKTKTLRTAFAVYPTTTAAGTQSAAPPPVNALLSLHEAQIKKMDPTGARTALVARNREAAQPGDVLMVTHRRGGEPFAGVCLSIRRRGIDTGVLLRNHLTKVPVEMWFKVYNRNVAGLEVIKRRAKRARRARLTYMRQAKHDMGSVEDLVFEWKRTRKVYSTGKPAAAGKGKDKGKKAVAAGGKKK
ncbi:translation protein SH3-like domain-containing protein [Staphylotrichum tortipilum]|uniref:Translation protein SH3-like domain-containing protein n=1 Tax=Staphylotrichum tortipilum TaxID=2831512 RepID=A0AAN6RSJ6_9PEZI|nr:translation protein SH3-like domain-containing protein [Staphylotrichum longicolle]